MAMELDFVVHIGPLQHLSAATSTQCCLHHRRLSVHVRSESCDDWPIVAPFFPASLVGRGESSLLAACTAVISDKVSHSTLAGTIGSVD